MRMSLHLKQRLSALRNLAAVHSLSVDRHQENPQWAKLYGRMKSGNFEQIEVHLLDPVEVWNEKVQMLCKYLGTWR